MWDLTYRPSRFDQVLGQTNTVELLKAAVRSGHAQQHSFLFYGGYGQGKSTLSRILAKALLCKEPTAEGEPCNKCLNCEQVQDETCPGFQELDAATSGNVATIREIVEQCNIQLPGIKKRVLILDEAHMLSREAQDVLLKPLEEDRLVGIFCTTEQTKIRGTIRSRCQTYQVLPIPDKLLSDHAAKILTEQKVSFEPGAIDLLVSASHGHARDLLNRLEQVAQYGEVTVPAVRNTLGLQTITDVYDILSNIGDPTRVTQKLNQALETIPESQLREHLLEVAMLAYKASLGLSPASSVLYDEEGMSWLQGKSLQPMLALAENLTGNSRQPLLLALLAASGVSFDADKVVIASPVVPSRVAAPTPASAPPQLRLVVAEPEEAPATPAIAAPTVVEDVAPPTPKSSANRPILANYADAQPFSFKPEILAPIDQLGRPESMPRGAKPPSNRASGPLSPVKAVSEHKLLTTTEFRVRFEQLIKGLRNNDDGGTSSYGKHD